MSNFKINIIFWSIIALFVSSGFWLLQIAMLAASSVNTGTGTYTGIIVETREHGIFWKTKGAHFKTGENSSGFEDFCVTDEAIFNRLTRIKPDSKMKVMYKKFLATPSWKCDIDDSSDIIVNFIVID